MPTRQRLGPADGRQQPLHRPDPLGQAAEQPGTAQQHAEPGALVQPQRAAQQPQPPRVGEEPEDQRPEGTVAPRPRVAALDLLAGGLDQLVVLHAGRAGGDAGHAAKALVEVADHLVVHGLALQPDLHQVDAATRRVHLLAPQQVGRAGRQAEAAVDAVVDQLLLRRVVQVEGGRDRGVALRPAGALGGAVGLPWLDAGLAGDGVLASRADRGRRPLVGRLGSVTGVGHVRSLPRSGRGRAGGRGRTAA
jgi:hypothetical protein